MTDKSWFNELVLPAAAFLIALLYLIVSLNLI